MNRTQHYFVFLFIIYGRLSNLAKIIKLTVISLILDFLSILECLIKKNIIFNFFNPFLKTHLFVSSDLVYCPSCNTPFWIDETFKAKRVVCQNSNCGIHFCKSCQVRICICLLMCMFISVYVYIYVCLYLSIYQSIHLSIYLSIYLSIISIYLSVPIYIYLNY